jgi:hypothetical protein
VVLLYDVISAAARSASQSLIIAGENMNLKI